MSTSVEQLSLQGLSYEKEGRYEDALTAYSSALDQDPTHQLTWFRRGILYGHLKKLTQAVIDMTRAIELDPLDGDAFFNRAILKSQMNEFEEALIDCEQAITLNSEDVEYHHERANILTKIWMMNEDDDAGQAALEAYTYVIENADAAYNPKHRAQAFGNRAKLRHYAGEFTEALSDIASAREFIEEDQQLYACEAWCLEELGRGEEALVAIEAAIGLGGDCPAFWHAMRARLLNGLGRSDEALQHATFGLKVDESSSACYSARGEAYYELDQFEKAIAEFTKVIELDGAPCAISFIRRAVAFIASDQPNEALHDLNTAIKLDPNNSYAYRTRAQVYLVGGRPDLAEEDNEYASQLDDGVIFEGTPSEDMSAEWHAVVEARSLFFETNFGGTGAIVPLHHLAGIWPGGGILEIHSDKLAGTPWVYATFGLTNVDMPCTTRGGEAGVGYECLILTESQEIWPFSFLAWLIDQEIDEYVNLISVVREQGSLVIPFAEDIHLNLLVTTATTPLPERIDLPNGSAAILIAIAITDEDMAFASKEGAAALAKRLLSADNGQISRAIT